MHTAASDGLELDAAAIVIGKLVAEQRGNLFSHGVLVSTPITFAIKLHKWILRVVGAASRNDETDDL